MPQPRLILLGRTVLPADVFIPSTLVLFTPSLPRAHSTIPITLERARCRAPPCLRPQRGEASMCNPTTVRPSGAYHSIRLSAGCILRRKDSLVFCSSSPLELDWLYRRGDFPPHLSASVFKYAVDSPGASSWLFIETCSVQAPCARGLNDLRVSRFPRRVDFLELQAVLLHYLCTIILKIRCVFAIDARSTVDS